MSRFFLNCFRGLLICIPFQGFSAEWTDQSIPVKLHVFDINGDAFVDLPAKGCSTAGRYKLLRTHPSFSEIYETLLSSQIAGKKVKIRFANCSKEANPRGEIIGVMLVD